MAGVSILAIGIVIVTSATPRIGIAVAISAIGAATTTDTAPAIRQIDIADRFPTGTGVASS